MGRSTKKTVKYIRGQLPTELGEILSNADENDLKILIALLMAAGDDGELPEELSVGDLLGMSSAEVNASLKFWRGAGIVGGARATAKAAKSESVENTEKAEKSEEKPQAPYTTAHRNGAVEKSVGISSYGSEELATLFEKRKVTAEFIDEAQRVFGKTFNSYDTGIVVGLIDQFGFEEEAVLAILSYVTRKGKKGVRAVEKKAIEFYDEGCTRTHEVLAKIELIERSKEIISKVKQLFGIGSRELSKTERTLFEKWTQKFEYDIDVIRHAYDITVDNTQKSAPKYTDRILENWYVAGLRTLDAIIEYENGKSKEKKEGSLKSYDLDDFYEAALQRSLEELK